MLALPLSTAACSQKAYSPHDNGTYHSLIIIMKFCQAKFQIHLCSGAPYNQRLSTPVDLIL